MSWVSVLPPLVALVVVLWRKEVIVALLAAIFAGELLQQAPAWPALPLAGVATLERTAAVFTSLDNARLFLFMLLIGGLMSLMRDSGGVAAMVNRFVRTGLASTPRRATLMTSIVGTVVFIESNLSVLTAGILSRGLFDRFGLSRAKLAYIIDSTSAPVCILILLNGWGAFVLALLGDYTFRSSAVSVLWGTVALNFYALISLALVFYTALTGRYHGPLARTTARGAGPAAGEAADDIGPPPTRARYMLLPLGTLIAGMLVCMLWTGDGDITAGSGSRSVLYATVAALLVAYLLLVVRPDFDHLRLVRISFAGMGELLPLVTIVLLSLALGATLRDLGTGDYIAGLVGDAVPAFLLPAMLFLAGALISFSTGTSWGTFAILVPIGMPITVALDLPPSLMLAAILGGGVFGDHCSPISDTTAVSAVASGCDLLEHVRTQMPYALFAGALTLVMYLMAGLLLIE
ncbi:MAG TPA: Na+/H+ antiporter NhaC family protein [Woeseiaceae bacterium]|nr:Na+/H+ antiporter NhaC family protein [Woeseiaceae bacterium]